MVCCAFIMPELICDNSLRPYFIHLYCIYRQSLIFCHFLDRPPNRHRPQPLMLQEIEPTKDFERKLKEEEKSGRKGRDFRLPAALEKMLAYKDERAREVW